MDHKREYPDYEAVQEHIRRARIERAVAVGNLIAGGIAACVRALGLIGSLMQRGMDGTRGAHPLHR